MKNEVPYYLHFNFLSQTSYADVKSLIHSKCGLTDVILDNLMSQDSAGKKVTVGVTDEHDAAIIIGKINGIFINGHQLVVENRQKKVSIAILLILKNKFFVFLYWSMQTSLQPT